ncbi:hypothetical protein E3N88_13327 [Mikania micrantha]|uniref:BED-type domain-containing protein n=1 Tax=Mikania micrantha TaxID=192012 RepID=A0A5N6P9A7_9ASTR|nr:hypothetical protein E3N88_13327 [Mikania micrantha]
MATIPIDNDSQEEDETFVDETPPNNVESSNVEEQTQQSSKRKQANNDEGTQSKVQRVGKHRAKCWESFTVVYLEEEDGVTRKNKLCKFCKHYIKADPIRNGTNGLRKHAGTCNLNPDVVAMKKQQNLVFKKESNGEGNVSVWKLDEVRINKALLDMFVECELAFKVVENPSFIEFTNTLNGKFKLPSRHKISRDIGKYYLDERLTKENPMSPQEIDKKVKAKVLEVENRLHELFKTYKEKFDKVEYESNSTSQEPRSEGDVVAEYDDNDFFAEFLNVEESNSVAIET